MKDDRLDWFACYPEKWLGALAAMKPDEGLVYVIICLRIYEKRGPIIDSNEALGRRTGYRPSHVAKIIDRLIELGKLKRTDEGGLMNPFAEREIAEGAEIALASAKKLSRAGKKSAEKRQQNQSQPPTQLQLQVTEEEEKKVVVRFAHPVRFPEDWIAPNEEALSFGRKKGWPDLVIEDQFQKFRLHYSAKGTKWERWDLVWCRWVITEIKWQKERPTHNGSRQHNGGKQSFAEIARGTDDEPRPNHTNRASGAFTG